MTLADYGPIATLAAGIIASTVALWIALRKPRPLNIFLKNWMYVTVGNTMPFPIELIGDNTEISLFGFTIFGRKPNKLKAGDTFDHVFSKKMTILAGECAGLSMNFTVISQARNLLRRPLIMCHSCGFDYDSLGPRLTLVALFRLFGRVNYYVSASTGVTKYRLPIELLFNKLVD